MYRKELADADLEELVQRYLNAGYLLCVRNGANPASYSVTPDGLKRWKDLAEQSELPGPERVEDVSETNNQAAVPSKEDATSMAFLFSVWRLDRTGSGGGGPLGLAIAVMAVHFGQQLSEPEAQRVAQSLLDRRLISVDSKGIRYRITTRGLSLLRSYRAQAGLPEIET